MICKQALWPRGRARGSAAPRTRSYPIQRILVVDDDLAIRELSTAVLTNSGYDVDTAEDGAAAWQALNADGYDLMITDQNMPKLTGVELLEKLRAARMDMPVILATGALPAKAFSRSPWLQPTATLLKPFTIEELLGMVKAIVGAAHFNSGAII